MAIKLLFLIMEFLLIICFGSSIVVSQSIPTQLTNAQTAISNQITLTDGMLKSEVDTQGLTIRNSISNEAQSFSPSLTAISTSLTNLNTTLANTINTTGSGYTTTIASGEASVNQSMATLITTVNTVTQAVTANLSSFSSILDALLTESGYTFNSPSPSSPSLPTYSSPYFTINCVATGSVNVFAISLFNPSSTGTPSANQYCVYQDVAMQHVQCVISGYQIPNPIGVSLIGAIAGVQYFAIPQAGWNVTPNICDLYYVLPVIGMDCTTGNLRCTITNY